MRTPMASRTALATAGPAAEIEGSPMPLAPKGPLPDSDSITIDLMSGTSLAVGIR